MSSNSVECSSSLRGGGNNQKNPLQSQPNLEGGIIRIGLHSSPTKTKNLILDHNIYPKSPKQVASIVKSNSNYGINDILNSNMPNLSNIQFSAQRYSYSDNFHMPQQQLGTSKVPLIQKQIDNPQIPLQPPQSEYSFEFNSQIENMNGSTKIQPMIANLDNPYAVNINDSEIQPIEVGLSDFSTTQPRYLNLQSSPAQYKLEEPDLTRNPYLNMIKFDDKQISQGIPPENDGQIYSCLPIEEQYMSAQLHSRVTAQSTLNNLINPPMRLLDQQQQQYVLQRNRSQSPQNSLRTSQNFGQAQKFYPSIYQKPSIVSNKQQLTSLPSYINDQHINESTNVINLHQQVSTSPEVKRSVQINSPTLSLQQSTGQASQQNFYKVASQIHRNQSKEKRPSLITHSNINNQQMNQKFKARSIPGVQTLINCQGISSLTMSENHGRATNLDAQIFPKNSQVLVLSQRSPQSVKRQNSQEMKDSRKRFTVVDKFNEKYTKKLIIDLCSHMNHSSEGKITEGQMCTRSERESRQIIVKDNSNQRPNSIVKLDNVNPNLNVLDILSHQRVLQRSVSYSKRGNLMSHTPSTSVEGEVSPLSVNDQKKIGNSSTKRLSFRFSEKPWENNSFQNNSKYGSYTVMRSMHNSQGHWNLESQNLNSSVSSLQTAAGLGAGVGGIISGSLSAQTTIRGITPNSTVIESRKVNSNNFILSGFNDSQEIPSSRHFNMGTSSLNKLPNDRKILTKNITADLNNVNPNNKYKFTNTHLNKPTTSFNAFANVSKQYVKNEPIISNTQSNKSPDKTDKCQPCSPIPTSYTDSKQSKNREIKKSLILPSPAATNKQRSSEENSHSHPESFEQFKNKEHEQDHGRSKHGAEYVEEDLYEDEMVVDGCDEDYDESPSSQSGSINEKPNANSQPTLPSSNSQNLEHTFVQNPHSGQQSEVNRTKKVSTYDFDKELEQHPDIHLNMEELQKERQKLIRKITQTFKMKNKALSTSQEYYKILHVIGKGAFAKVFLAIQLLTGKLVAIKLIDKQILRSESAKKRVLQEVHILKKLNGHRHVLKLLEVFENRKFIFIVTEYFCGSDLMKMMKERNGQPFSEQQVLYMLAQLLSGMRYIHANMVLHRDIKLDNLLVDSQLNLKIIDFGISRIIQKDQRMTEQCGTPAFLAPEIIANKGYEGFASDMWSLGVLLYILLFGKVPFKGNNLSELHRNILNGVLPVEEMKDTQVSIYAQEIIHSLLRIKVKDRQKLEGIIASRWMKGIQIPDGIDQKSNRESEVIDNRTSMLRESEVGQSKSQILQNDGFDEKIINYIEGFGYSREYILRCLNKGSLSHVNATYKVIKNSQSNNNSKQNGSQS